MLKILFSVDKKKSLELERQPRGREWAVYQAPHLIPSMGTGVGGDDGLMDSWADRVSVGFLAWSLQTEFSRSVNIEGENQPFLF